MANLDEKLHHPPGGPCVSIGTDQTPSPPTHTPGGVTKVDGVYTSTFGGPTSCAQHVTPEELDAIFTQTFQRLTVTINPPDKAHSPQSISIEILGQHGETPITREIHSSPEAIQKIAARFTKGCPNQVAQNVNSLISEGNSCVFTKEANNPRSTQLTVDTLLMTMDGSGSQIVARDIHHIFHDRIAIQDQSLERPTQYIVKVVNSQAGNQNKEISQDKKTQIQQRIIEYELAIAKDLVGHSLQSLIGIQAVNGREITMEKGIPLSQEETPIDLSTLKNEEKKCTKLVFLDKSIGAETMYLLLEPHISNRTLKQFKEEIKDNLQLDLIFKGVFKNDIESLDRTAIQSQIEKYIELQDKQIEINPHTINLLKAQQQTIESLRSIYTLLLETVGCLSELKDNKLFQFDLKTENLLNVASGQLYTDGPTTEEIAQLKIADLGGLVSLQSDLYPHFSYTLTFSNEELVKQAIAATTTYHQERTDKNLEHAQQCLLKHNIYQLGVMNLEYLLGGYEQLLEISPETDGYIPKEHIENKLKDITYSYTKKPTEVQGTKNPDVKQACAFIHKCINGKFTSLDETHQYISAFIYALEAKYEVISETISETISSLK